MVKLLLSQKEKDNNNNVTKGNVITHNSSNNLIISKDKLTALVGLKNIAVINLNDKTLIIDISKSEDVRYIIEKLENNFK